MSAFGVNPANVFINRRQINPQALDNLRINSNVHDETVKTEQLVSHQNQSVICIYFCIRCAFVYMTVSIALQQMNAYRIIIGTTTRQN